MISPVWPLETEPARHAVSDLFELDRLHVTGDRLMHTIIVIVGGLLLLGLCLLIGRLAGGASPSAAARSALWFIPLWLAAAAVNMWIGVSQAGYSVAQELPIFLLVFAVPAAAALFLWWKLSRR